MRNKNNTIPDHGDDERAHGGFPVRPGNRVAG
jgi:hypothetical protein